MKQKLFFLLTILVLVIATLTRGIPVVAQDEPLSPTLTHPKRTQYTVLDPNGEPGRYTPPPAIIGRSAPTANIQVHYSGSWTAPAQNAFEFAVSIWEQLIVSPVTIHIDAEFSNLGPGILGGAGPNNYYRAFSGAPRNDVWYPIALANRLAGTDLDGAGNSEIGAQFSSTANWYYGTDGNPPHNQIDFVSVVLHEIGHGLGFLGSMTVQGGVGFWGSGTPYPDVYDLFTETQTGQKLINFQSGSAALAAQLTGGNIYFNGLNTLAANNGNRAKLYAPNNWQQGSSYGHLDEIYNNTPHSLMTYAIAAGVAEHNPGDITLGIFRDMGWQTANIAPQEPSWATLPTQIIEKNSSKNNAIDLWAYVSDQQSAANQLTFTITNQSNPNVGATIDNNRYLDINPVAGWTGQSAVTVRATDPQNNSATTTFQVKVINVSNKVYFPMLTK